MKKFPETALQPGSVIQGYEILRFLGQGGCALTYCAQKKRDPDRGLVAIKEFFPAGLVARGKDGQPVRKPGTDRGQLDYLADRFFKEAETVSRFDHPHLVKGIEVFEKLGTAYLVMRYETGKSLRQSLRDRYGTFQARPAILAAILRKLQQGLIYCHARNCLHCDIKPSNIYLGRDLDPVLLDFGSARAAVRAPGAGATASPDMLTYTPHYAPYEQCPKGKGRIGPWTDIYQLAAVIYRCLTGGKLPDGEVRAADPAIFWPLTEFAPLPEGEWPAEFLRGIDRGLGLYPEDRPQTVARWNEEMKAVIETMETGGRAAPPRESLVHGAGELVRKVKAAGKRAAKAEATETVVSRQRAKPAPVPPPLPGPARREPLRDDRPSPHPPALILAIAGLAIALIVLVLMALFDS